MAGITNPIPDPKGLIVVKIAVIITLHFSVNQVPLILAGELIINGYPAPAIKPPRKTNQNPLSFKNILTKAPTNVNAIPKTIATYG